MGNMDFRKFLLILFPILVIFRPYPIELFPEMATKISLEMLFFAVVLFLNLKVTGMRNTYFYVFLTLYFFSLVTGIILNLISQRSFSSFFDFYDFFYLFYVSLIYRLYSNISFSLDEILISSKYIVVCGVIVIIVNILALNVSVIENILKHIYYQKSASSFEYNRFRISGTFTNPNHFGLFLCTITYLCLKFGRFFLSRKFIYLNTIILSIGIYFTGSRTALIILFLIFMYISLSKLNIKNIIQFCLMVTLLPITIYPILNPRLKESVDLIIKYGPLAIDSFKGKYELSIQNLKMVIENNFFGFGPSNNISFFVGDNQHMLILWKGGIIGYIAFLIFYYHITFSNSKNLVIYFLSLLTFFTGEFFESQQLITFIIIISHLISELGRKFPSFSEYRFNTQAMINSKRGNEISPTQ